MAITVALKSHLWNLVHSHRPSQRRVTGFSRGKIKKAPARRDKVDDMLPLVDGESVVENEVPKPQQQQEQQNQRVVTKYTNQRKPSGE